MESSLQSSRAKGPAALADSLLGKVLDEMFEGFQVIDHQWRYLYVNKTVTEQGKEKGENLLGRTMMECYPGIDKTPLFAQLHACKAENREIRMENEFTYPDGTSRWFQLLLQPIKVGVLILSIDITGEKKIKAELMEKIERIELLTKVTLDRELRMAELKQQIAELRELTGAVAVTRA